LRFFVPKQPLPDDQLSWVEAGFAQLDICLGRKCMVTCDVVLPNDHFFPDPYDAGIEAVRVMARRIAGYMQVDPGCFEVSLYTSIDHTLRKDVPIWSGRNCDAAGLYFHQPEDGVYTIGINEDQLADPIRLSATLAHELAHVLLLGGGLVKPDKEDMEPLTDLATVYLGLGVLTSSAAFQFRQWTNNRTQGWSVNRQGYLPEAMWGYALAKFAHLRNERHPSWVAALARNIRNEYRSADRWLERG